MAKKKLPKKLVGKLRMTRWRKWEGGGHCPAMEYFAGYELRYLGSRHMEMRLCEKTLHRVMKGILCPPGKTATVKVTLEVEGIE